MVRLPELDEECYYFAVFDGHFGADASYYCHEHFHVKFVEQMLALMYDLVCYLG